MAPGREGFADGAGEILRLLGAMATVVVGCAACILTYLAAIGGLLTAWAALGPWSGLIVVPACLAAAAAMFWAMFRIFAWTTDRC